MFKHVRSILLRTVATIHIVCIPARAEGEPPLDYGTLTHVVAIESLRAGSHDASGTNQYAFSARMFALLNSTEERNAAFEARKKLEVDLGTFGDTTLEALGQWRQDEKQKEVKGITIQGKAIRELTAKAMQDFGAKEELITVMVELTMFERNKRFFFFGEDTVIAKTSYSPIPPTKFDAPLRTNQVLTLTDDKGTVVKIAVRYEKPAAAAQVPETPSPEGAKTP